MAGWWHEFLAGSVGGMAGLMVGHPADTVKVRQQTLNLPVWQTVVNTYRYEGIAGFLKGMSFPLFSTGALNAIYFGVYSSSLRTLGWLRGEAVGREAERVRYLDVFLAGCAGGLAQLSVAVPVDLVKIRLQTRTAGHVWRPHPISGASGPLACLAELYRGGGLRAWYHGTGAMAARDVGSFGLYICLYEWLGREVRARTDLSAPLVTVAAGGAAGVISWASVLPLDVLKSRIQADDPGRRQYRGLLHCAQLTLLRDGPAAFFSGFTMVAGRAFLVNAVTFLGYEYSLKLLQDATSQTRGPGFALGPSTDTLD